MVLQGRVLSFRSYVLTIELWNYEDRKGRKHSMNVLSVTGRFELPEMARTKARITVLDIYMLLSSFEGPRNQSVFWEISLRGA